MNQKKTMKSKDKMIQFTLSIPSGGDDDSDDTWYPPPHPKSSTRRRMRHRQRNQMSSKSIPPNEERWNFWKKQLPNEIEYCKEEIDYFMKQPKEDRKRFLQEEKDLLTNHKVQIPLRFKFLNLKEMNDMIRLMIINKIDDWYAMEPGNSEYSKMHTWIDSLNRIPFGSYAPSIQSILKEKQCTIATYMHTIKQTMDRAVFGHEEAKESIMEIIARDYLLPKEQVASGFALGIQGPPGNGKTTLIKEGISKALNRPFCLIGLGGAKNSSSFVGHDYTYEGGTYGRIIQALMMANVMNPIIYFDELDKLSQDSQGDEIANLLCHLTDPSQNTLFEDKYFSGIPINVSNVMFIFSFNDESKLNRILKDRIQIIRTEGLNPTQKITIAEDYIIPDIQRELPSVNIEWSKTVLSRIIDFHCEKEQGVRNLRRALFTISRKVNLHSLLSSDTQTFTKPMLASSPDDKIKISIEMVEEYLKTSVPQTHIHGYI